MAVYCNLDAYVLLSRPNTNLNITSRRHGLPSGWWRPRHHQRQQPRRKQRLVQWLDSPIRGNGRFVDQPTVFHAVHGRFPLAGSAPSRTTATSSSPTMTPACSSAATQRPPTTPAAMSGLTCRIRIQNAMLEMPKIPPATCWACAVLPFYWGWAG